ncbi:DUF4440 domain-containing protein [Rhizobium rhizosphaerae]|uniref:DUF4440 domain-containing protein n=1 Tax=Xaviernesmea rhizosphaerae TaxID=1672749 RepID=A0A1Q9AQD5_9HYPH|nr:nuclear transport factor 2 family protein [Xaviernesmea rhizosphaerae]OLP57630.1 DUF4440 domain-containing protein [Xaviernesmea rhizosphaerae]
MMIDPVRRLIDFHAAINALDFATIEAAFAEDAVYASGKVGALEGRAAIMAAFRRYFAQYPDQVAEDSLVEAVSPLAARSVWRLKAHDATSGAPLIREGEETITFNHEGRILSVAVTDYAAL